MTNDPTGSVRKPDVDTDGLDCFATEGVSVDTADDAAVLVDVQPAVPTVREKALNLWRRAERGEFAKPSIVGVSILAVTVLAFQIVKQPAEPMNGLAEVSAPRTPATPPIVSAAPQAAARVAPVLIPPPAVDGRAARPEAAGAVVRSTSASAPLPGSPAPAARMAGIAVPPDTPVQPVAPSSAAIESPVVIALPEVVRAEPELPRAAAGLAPVVITVPSDRSSIERVLEAYREAYDRLDAPSAAVIWPRVDTRALSRAFSTLSEQDLSFDSCDLDIAGAQAKAHCIGEIRYVRRVGDQTRRVRKMSWLFALERVSDRWQIAQVTAD